MKISSQDKIWVDKPGELSPGTGIQVISWSLLLIWTRLVKRDDGAPREAWNLLF